MEQPELPWSDVSRLVNANGDGKWVAQRIAEWRLEAGWTQAELATAYNRLANSSLTKVHISKIENPGTAGGRKDISIREAVLFAQVFDKSLAELVLPPDSLQQVDGWRWFLDAAQHLMAARDALTDYRDALDVVRARIASHPELGRQIRQWGDTAEQDRREAIDAAWEISEPAKPRHGAAYREFVAGNSTTPAVAAAQDALSDAAVPHDLWIRRDPRPERSQR